MRKRTLSAAVGLVAVAIVVLLSLQRWPERGRSRAGSGQPESDAGGTSSSPAATPDGPPRATPDPAVARGVLVLPSSAWPSSTGERATATILADGAMLLTTTLSSGSFELPYRRSASDDASFCLVVDTDLTPEARVELPAPRWDVGRIVLVSSGVYGGTVVDATGTALPSLTVTLRIADGTVLAQSAPSTEHGRFHMGLPPSFVLPTVERGGEPVGLTLDIAGPGVSYAPVPANISGLRCEHHVVLPDPVRVRLKFVAEADGSPVSNVPVELRRWNVRRDGIGEVLDRGATDAGGVYAPRWTSADDIVAVHLQVPDRPRDLIWFVPFPDSHDAGPVTLPVPASPFAMTVQVVRAGSDAPVAGAVFHVCGVCDRAGQRAQIQHTARTDEHGFAQWDLGRAGGIPPDSIHPFYWSCTYLAERGLPVEERGTFDADSGHGSEPYVVAVGQGSDRPVVPLWFVLDDGTEGAATGATPTRLVVTVTSGDDTASLQFADVLSAPFRNGDGALLHRVYGLAPPADVRNIEHCRIDFHVQFDAIQPTWQAVTLAEWTAALSSRTPLHVRVPPAPGDPASLIVTAPTGEPRAGAVVTLIPDSVRHASVIWSDRVLLTTDARGHASLGCLAGGVAYRGVATDLRTGEAAFVEAVRADSRDLTVMLDAPRELKLTARLGGGTLPRARSALLRSEPCGLLPDVKCTWSDSGEVRAPGVCLAGYTLFLDCYTPAGGRSQLEVPAARAQGNTVELPPIAGETR